MGIGKFEVDIKKAGSSVGKSITTGKRVIQNKLHNFLQDVLSQYGNQR